MTVPLQLPLLQKFALGALFSSRVIIIAFVVIRIVITNVEGDHVEVSWLNLWSQIEASVAVIISSVPALEVLFAKKGNVKSPHEEGNKTGRLSGKGCDMGKSVPPSGIRLSARSTASEESSEY